MFLFNNDYNRICHPAVFEYLSKNSDRQMPGYGTDLYSQKAAELIKQKCGRSDIAVHFLLGGTQTNLALIASALRPHQAVIGAVSAHVNVHETGAIEATGHKVITLMSQDGKITAKQVLEAVREQRESPDAEHFAQPKLVYISNPTEYGTIYTLSELFELSDTCRNLGLYLYVDGARLGYGLTSADNDVTLSNLAELSDAFYIGGTKVGAMFGEALVISNPSIAEDFRYIMKQRGALLAKGWLIGQQFVALLEDDLYFRISSSANAFADRLRSTISDLGYKLFVENNTNQVFVILPNQLLDKLSENFSFALWEQIDQKHSVVRFCTSWATEESEVQALCDELIRLSSHIKKEGE